ncbi:fumarate hydratase [Candidatus Latescibacterota bacterium]
MRTLSYDHVVENVARLVISSNYELPGDVLEKLIRSRAQETSEPAVSILDQIIENARIASEDQLPICQDTGIAVFFADVGNDVRVDGEGLEVAIQEGTRQGYRNGDLRMSIVCDPLRRVNTGDNTPAVIHCRCVPGENIVLSFCPKGGGCENMSRIAMLNPGEGRDGVTDFIVDTVRSGGGRPCPPVIIGVGIGGNYELAAILSKRALLRSVGVRHSDSYYSEFESELLERINKLGVGPMGLGGSTTALDVFIEAAPCHIASLPVSVNVQCHAARHGTTVL